MDVGLVVETSKAVPILGPHWLGNATWAPMYTVWFVDPPRESLGSGQLVPLCESTVLASFRPLWLLLMGDLKVHRRFLLALSATNTGMQLGSRTVVPRSLFA